MSVVRTLIGNVRGPQGATGATGATGAQGEAATIQIGTVTTGAYGTNASVTNSGTEQDAVFDFVIPQGQPGEEVTDASNLTLNEITASSASYPTFTVQERLKGIFGKIQKFLSDLKNNYVSKSMMTTSTDVDTAGQAVADAKAIKSLNDSLANIYNYVTVLPLGNYSQVGQTATFSLDVTKAKMVRVQCGWNSEANNSGTHYDYYPAIDIAAVYCTTYIVRAQLQYVVFSFPTKNSIKIIASSNTDIGIRRVDAVF